MIEYPPTKTKPWPHQVEVWRRAQNLEAFMIAHDMGAGKSKTAIDFCTGIAAFRVLILCPKSVIAVWPRQFATHAEAEYRVVPLIKGSTEDKAALMQRTLEVYGKERLVFIVNYESAIRPPLGPEYHPRTNRIVTPGALYKQGWDVMIVDESHRIKAPGGKASWLCAKLRPRAKRRLCLTGTPMPHALAADCPVLTPTGWIPIGKLSIGDMVIGSNGNKTRVVGVWPQGKQPLYSVRLSDGGETVCTGDHLWQVTSRGRQSRRLAPLTKRTEELLDPLPIPRSNRKERVSGRRSLFDQGGAARWSIPIAGVSQLDVQRVPIDPYLMGVLLGDGTMGNSIGFSTADPQIAIEVEKVLPRGLKLVEHPSSSHGKAIDYRITSGKRGGSLKGPIRGPAKNPLMVAIGSLGLRYHRSEEKFIPDCYLWNVAEVRLSILQGLCDTDGSTCAGGSPARYTTTSKMLADGVAFLVRSLGGLVTTSVRPARIVTLPNKKKTNGRPMYCLLIRMPLNPFRLERKRSKYKVSPRIPRRSIVAIEPSRASDAVCITVDAPDGLYVIKDFVVTHNSPLDIYAQYRFLDPNVLDPSFTRFRARYAIMGGFQGKQVVNFRGLSELQRRIYSIAHRVTKDEVLELPEMMHEDRPVTLSPRADKLYHELENEFYAQVESGEVTIANALVKLLRLQQITSGFVKADSGDLIKVDDGKREMLADIFQDIAPEEPVVVFCNFHSDLDSVKDAAYKAGRSSCEMSGRVNELEEWQMGEHNVIAVQIKAGGLGVDFTRSCYVIYYSLGFSLGDYEQSLARAHRPGQTRKVLVYHLVAENTIDVTVYGALRRKKNVIESVLTRRSVEEAA